MGGDATETVGGCHQVARKCIGTGNGQVQPLCSPQRAYALCAARSAGPWPGRGHARPGTAREACPEILRVLGARQRRVADFPKCWRRARVDFSPSPDAYPDIFHPRLELFPRLASRGVDFSRFLAACPCGIVTKARRLSRHFSPAPRVADFSRRLAARPCLIFT